MDCVLDVGANEGQWARALRRAGYRGPVISFEPLAAVSERLRAAAAGDPRWHVQRLALGAEDGQLTLHRTRGSDLSSALAPTRYAQTQIREAIEVTADEVVPVRRLDGLLPELLPDLATARLFLKMDTQGFDLRVFEGAEGVLSRIVGLQSELSVLPLYEGMPGYLDALAAYAAHGYAPTGFFPIVRTQPYLVLCEFDCVMARHERVTAVPPAPADAPPVTVVVTACADSTALRQCLGAVREQAHALGGEVLLAMNTVSTALAVEARHALEALCDRLVFEPKVGKSHALNSAVSLSRGAVIAFTDDDAEPQPGWLAALTAPLLAPDRDPTLVGCGGPVLPVYPEEVMPAWFRSLIEEKRKHTHFLTPVHELGPAPIDYETDGKRGPLPIGANCAYRREVFASYHYDPRLGPNRDTGMRGGEDFLIGLLLLRDGYRLRYCPDARVRHPAHPERMTEAWLRHSYYVQGIEHVRRSRAVTGRPGVKKAKTRLKLAVLRLKLLLLSLLPRQARLFATRMRWLAKYERCRGQLAELKMPDDGPGLTVNTLTLASVLANLDRLTDYMVRRRNGKEAKGS